MASALYNNVPQTIEELSVGHHLCQIYETEKEHRDLLTPYLVQGLEQHEKVLYIIDTHTADAILTYLDDVGFDPKPYLDSGQFAILTHRESYMKGGSFDPDRMIDLLKSETEKAVKEGYAALRVTGEMTWALRGLPGSEKLFEYEAKLNDFIPGSKALAICQYDRKQFNAEMLLKVMSTHPIIVIGANICDNPFYVLPEEFLRNGNSQILHSVASEAIVTCWLENMRVRTQMEERLTALNARHVTTLAAVPDIIAEVDTKKCYTWMNKAGLDFFGDDAIGREAADYFLGEQDTYSAVKPLFNGDEDTYIVDSWQRRKDGEKRLLRWSCRVLKDERGRVQGALSTARDMTDIRRAEKAREDLVAAEARAEVEHARFEELRIAYGKLQDAQAQLVQAEKLTGIGLLSAGVAHELASPVTGLLLLIDARMARGIKDKKVHSEFVKMRDAVCRMAAIINDLRAFARESKGERELCDLNDIIDATMSFSAHMLHMKGIKIVNNYATNLPKNACIRNQLQQVVLNIVNNARDAMSQGGTLTIATRVADDGERVLMSFADTGEGVRPEHLAKIFDPFFTTKEQGQGIGLGLSVSHGIVAEHGGEITVESSPGSGATFTVALPIAKGAPYGGGKNSRR